MLDLLAIFLLAIIIHEFGHCLGFMMFGHRPTVRVAKPGSIEVGGNCWYKLNAKQSAIMLALGVALGGLYIAIVSAAGGRNLMLLYLFISMADIINLLSYFQIRKEWRSLPLLEVNKRQLAELERQNGSS